MSHQLAAHLARHGRGPDTMLMHVAPSEVAGLAALARAYGGALTVNPKTGLPEAGFLSSILPMVAGAFLGPAGIGMFSTGLGAATAVGGVTALTSGSLSRGLMAGLGAYGGSGLAEGVLGAGAGAAGADFIPSGLQAANAAQPAQALGAAYSPAMDSNLASMAMPPTPQAPMPAAPTTAVAPSAISHATSPDFLSRLGVNTTTQMPNWAQLGDGLSAVARDPGGFFTADKWAQAKNAGMALAPMFMDQSGGQAPEQPRGNIKRFTFSRNPQDPGPLEDSSERTWFNPQLTFQSSTPAPRMASGGVVAAYADGGMTGDSLAAYNYLMGRGPAPTARPPAAPPPGQTLNIYRRPEAPSAEAPPANDGNLDYGGNGVGVGLGGVGGTSMGLAGLLGNTQQEAAPVTSLGPSEGAVGTSDAPSASAADGGVGSADGTAYARGGGVAALRGRFLQGAGDGVSDDIPAAIDGKRPAALADGEFVIPARAVSEIGNGSSAAGAKRLYAMLDRIQARRGKSMGGNVAVDSGAWQELPA